MTATVAILIAGGAFAVGWFGGRWDHAAAAERRLERLPHHGPPLSHLRLLPARIFDQDAS